MELIDVILQYIGNVIYVLRVLHSLYVDADVYANSNFYEYIERNRA